MSTGGGTGSGTSGNMDDANISDVGLALGGFATVDDATAAQDAAQAEADAQGAAIGEMDAYANQVSLSPAAKAFNFISPIDITKTHDEFGRGVTGLSVSPMGVVGTALGGFPGMAMAALGKGLGDNVSLGSLGSFPGPGTNDATSEPDAGGDYYVTPAMVAPVSSPVTGVADVASPISVQDYSNPSLLMRPSTFNVAPANAPTGYSLLYPDQEQRFQESFALRPEYYSGPLTTTGYQPVVSLLI